jgi:hypothetical protein
VSVGHGEEEEQRRFVREVVPWLKHASDELASQGGRLTTFAAPKFLGLLREYCGPADAARLDLREDELTHLLPHELAEHPAVRTALGWPKA